jgi:hypothetical protein
VNCELESLVGRGRSTWRSAVGSRDRIRVARKLCRVKRSDIAPMGAAAGSCVGVAMGGERK